MNECTLLDPWAPFTRYAVHGPKPGNGSTPKQVGLPIVMKKKIKVYPWACPEANLTGDSRSCEVDSIKLVMVEEI